ncbi:MAG: hypothetical protein JKY54_17845 [Flavobacteriales bacterium]|nr:hypothetical protein [Flavobacteriales bacterium]
MKKGERYIENHYVETWLDDGIIYVNYKTHLKKITIDIAKQNILDRLYVTQGVTRPCIILSNNAVTVDRESRKLFADGDGIKHLSAGVILVDNYLSKLVANIFLSQYMPIKLTKVPTKLFHKTEKKQAIKWLRNYTVERLN